MNELSYIAEKIRKLMNDRGMSYRKLAEKTGLSQRTVYLTLVEPEARTLKTLHRIAEALNVPLYTLFLPDGLRFYSCPKCGKLFVAGEEARHCPYCKAKL